MLGVLSAPKPLTEIGCGFTSQRHGRIQWKCTRRRRIRVTNCVEVTAVGIKNKVSKTKGGRSRLFIKEEQSTSPNDSDGNNAGIELPVHVQYISSVANPYIKHLVKLRQSSCYRHSVGFILVVGSTPLREVSKFLQQKDAEAVVDYLFVQDGVDISIDLLGASRRIVHVTPPVMQKLAGIESTEATEAVGVIRLPGTFCNMETVGIQSLHFQKGCSSPYRLLVLDGIQDPGNLGTLLRTAVAFQWDGVFLLPGCCDPFNEKALRASQGACFQLPIATGLWSHLEVLRDLYQMDMYAGQPDNKKTMKEMMQKKRVFLVQDANSDISSQTDLAVEESSGSNGFNPILLSNEFASATAEKPLCLVLGSEGKGLSEQSKRSCSLVSIPMPGEFESLNVSVAGGIFLFLLQRQHATN